MNLLNVIWELIKIVGSIAFLALVIGILIITVQSIIEVIKEE